MGDEVPGPGPEEIAIEHTDPADILQKEGDTKVIPMDKKYPSNSEDYKDKEVIKKGEIAKPIDEQRFRELSDWMLGKENPENLDEVGEIRAAARDFFGSATANRRLGHVDAFKGKGLDEVAREFSSRPDFLRENLFREFVETIEHESKETLLNGQSELGKLAPEERLAVETIYGFPRAILNQIRLNKEKERSNSIQKQYFEGLSPTSIVVEGHELRQIQTTPEFAPEQNQRLQSVRQWVEALNKSIALKRELGTWQQDLYKFVLSNQSNPSLPSTMRSFFTAFEENMAVQENFSRFIGKETKDDMAMLRSGALAVVTAVKAFQQIGENEVGRVPTDIFLPGDVRSDTEHGIDIMAGGKINYLILQVKHSRKLTGVEIDGELAYNDPEFAQDRRNLVGSSIIYKHELGRESVVVPRMVIVGKIGQEARYTGIPQHEIKLSGKTTSRQIWQEGGQVWTSS